jgi:hypothetical protein
MNRKEALQAAAKRVRAYEHVFSSPDGKAVLEDLERQFNGTTLKKDKDGKIDPHASIAAAGCREVLLYIDLMRKRHAITAGDS